MSIVDSLSHLLRSVWNDLVNPFPGRLAQTWRIALTCALTTMIASVYGIPEAAISCYLVFFVMKADAAEGSILAVGLTVLVVFVVALVFLITRWVIDVPALRIVAIAATSLILLYLGSASQLGELGGIIALVVAFVLSLLGNVPFGEAATRGILYAWLMATMPMACVLVVNLTMGLKPTLLLRRTVEQRLLACADWLAQPTPQHRARLREQISEGQEIALKRLSMTRLLALGRGAENRRLARALRETYRLAIIALALPTDTAQADREAMAAEARRTARALGAGLAACEPERLPVGGATAVDQIWGALRDMAGTPERFPCEGPGAPFMRADARTNPEHMRYAVKTTTAAIICYLIYTGMQWQGIHTAMITCYVAALGSVAETVHKLALRIVGCLIGAALGIASIVFLMPHMTSVGAIMLLVFIGTFVSAWVWVGNERVSYAGVQIALAFLLTVLQGSGPTFDMDTARDRVMGILLGNCVLYIVVSQLWPVSVRERVRDCLHQALTHLGAMARMAPAGRSVQDARDLRVEQASKAAANIADMRQALGLAQLDIYRQRLSGAELRRVASAARTVRQAISRLVLCPPNDAGQAQRLQMLANRAMQMPADPNNRAHGVSVRHASASDGGNTLDHDIHRLETLINGR